MRNVREVEGAVYLGFVLDQSFLASATAWTMAASQFGHRTYDDPWLILPYMRQLYDLGMIQQTLLRHWRL